jgi:hypothetical protein
LNKDSVRCILLCESGKSRKPETPGPVFAFGRPRVPVTCRRHYLDDESHHVPLPSCPSPSSSKMAGQHVRSQDRYPSSANRGAGASRIQIHGKSGISAAATGNRLGRTRRRQRRAERKCNERDAGDGARGVQGNISEMAQTRPLQGYEDNCDGANSIYNASGASLSNT